MNLEEEVRDGYTISREMKLVWNLQMQMTMKLLEVCRRHNLHVWASCGTLLGAVRHRGFIPWDDDIDMEMPREDYDKLVQLAPQEFQAPYFFQCAQTERFPYPRGHAQLRYDGTSAIISGGAYDQFHQGIFVDIFILDGIPESKHEREALSQQLDKAKQCIQAYGVHFPLSRHPQSYAKYYLSLLQRLKEPFSAAYARYEELLKSHPDSAILCKIGLNHSLRYMMTRAFPAECYQDTIMLPFEDIELPAPSGYDCILTILYGNYMKPAQVPPMHGGYLALSHDQDYTISIRQIRREILLRTLKKIFRKLTFRS